MQAQLQEAQRKVERQAAEITRIGNARAATENSRSAVTAKGWEKKREEERQVLKAQVARLHDQVKELQVRNAVQ